MLINNKAMKTELAQAMTCLKTKKRKTINFFQRQKKTNDNKFWKFHLQSKMLPYGKATDTKVSVNRNAKHPVNLAPVITHLHRKMSI